VTEVASTGIRYDYLWISIALIHVLCQSAFGSSKSVYFGNDRTTLRSAELNS
jgi:hypothetical protein